MFLAVIERQEELEALIPFFESFEEDIVFRSSRRDVSENWVYYSDYNNELLNEVFEVFEVRSVEKIDGKLYREASIQFECKAKPKTVEYWGFYYVEDGEPVGWGGSKFYYPTEREGNGYRYRGSGTYYTERIVDNWYYFETAF